MENKEIGTLESILAIDAQIKLMALIQVLIEQKIITHEHLQEAYQKVSEKMKEQMQKGSLVK